MRDALVTATPSLSLPTRTRPDATARILEAAAARLAVSGAGALTMQEVAEKASVSKGLIHYHFHDKDTLLARLALWMAEGLVRREHAALAASTPLSAIDDLWRWISDELARGHVRALVELAGWRGGRVRAAAAEATRLRRAASTTSAERLFGLLSLRSRVPPPLLGDLLVIFVDGLAAAPADSARANPRAAFDVLWLALLELAE